jgi:hypothetical protein
MDDATRMYLLPKRVQPLAVPFTIEKERVLDMTKQLLDGNMTGNLQKAFDLYVTECMMYLIARDYENVERSAPEQRTRHDRLMLPSRKNLDFFVKRKKNKKLVI